MPGAMDEAGEADSVEDSVVTVSYLSNLLQGYLLESTKLSESFLLALQNDFFSL